MRSTYLWDDGKWIKCENEDDLFGDERTPIEVTIEDDLVTIVCMSYYSKDGRLDMITTRPLDIALQLYSALLVEDTKIGE